MLARTRKAVVAVGPLEVRLPAGASGESVQQHGRTTTLRCVLMPGVGFSLSHVAGLVQERRQYLTEELARLRPRRYEWTSFSLGGARLNAIEMFEPTALESQRGSSDNLSMVVGATELAGDLVAVSWMTTGTGPSSAHVKDLVGTILEHVITRRQRSGRMPDSGPWWRVW